MTPSPATVLFVDDDADSRFTFRWLLQRAGFAVKEAASGSEALRLAGEHPDIVVLDVNLPDINGFEVCRRIKAHPGTRAIPVLHLSGAHVTSEDRSHGLDQGADGYLTKPVEPKELIAHVRALVRIHQAEEQARAVARQWQATFDAIRDGICLLDRDGRVVRCNQALGRILGVAPDDLLGRTHEELVEGGGWRVEGEEGPASSPSTLHPPPSTLRETPFARMLTTRRREVAELRLGERWLHVVADPLPGPAGGEPCGTPLGEPPATSGGGGVAGAVYIVSDVTEHKSLEAQLHHAQKMEAVGRLAGGVAHDFNNLLTGILGNVSLFLAAAPKDSPQYGVLRTLEQAGWRAAELVRQLLGFSRRTALHMQPVSLRETIGEVVGILEQTLGQRIRLEVRVAASLPLVLADPSRLNQVLMNLCLNARDAMPEGGHLLLEGEGVLVADDHPRRHVEARAGRFVRLRVADTGHGIPPDVLPRIFEPFFTTKERGKGSGLGLAIVFGIVEQHRGWVECESDLGRGTRFDVYLPAEAGGGWREEGGGRRQRSVLSSPSTLLPPPSSPGGGHETVLLVDDDPMIRDLGLTWLRRHGYEALAAEDGLAAVEIFARERGRVRLVVLNLEMPRLSGRAALEQLLQLDPGVRVVIASGLGGEQLPAVGNVEGLAFVAKPYREEDLLAAVRAALDRAAR